MKKLDLDIVIFVGRMDEFVSVLSEVIEPIERKNNFKFIKNYADNTWKAPGYRVVPAVNLKHVLGLKNYQLVKAGTFFENKDYEAVCDHHRQHRMKCQTCHRALHPHDGNECPIHGAG